MAFATGAALFVAAAAAVVSDGAAARGQGFGLFQSIFAPSGAGFENFRPYYASSRFSPFESSLQRLGRPRFVDLPLEYDGYARHRHGARAAAAKHRKPAPYSVAVNYSSRRPVCVRLCDGYFFPASVPTGAAEDAVCDGLCPDAPTALYYQPAGSDDIGEAYTTDGKRYVDLPVALRYRSTHDNTCTCHRSFVSALDPSQDATLRAGDALMTPHGFRVFRGAGPASHRPSDFAVLDAAAMPKDERAALKALERVSLAPQPGVTRSWVAAATAAAHGSAAVKSAMTDKIRPAERAD